MEVQEILGEILQDRLASNPWAYLFCVIAILLQPIVAWYVYKKQDKYKAALKVPMFVISIAYLIIQYIVFWKYLRHLPLDKKIYADVIQGIMLFAFIVVEFALMKSNVYAERVELENKDRIQEFNKLKQMIGCELAKITNSSDNNRVLQVYERMKYENPVSKRNVEEENIQLRELIENLSQFEGIELEERCEKIELLLEQRKIKMLGEID